MFEACILPSQISISFLIIVSKFVSSTHFPYHINYQIYTISFGILPYQLVFSHNHHWLYHIHPYQKPTNQTHLDQLRALELPELEPIVHLPKPVSQGCFNPSELGKTIWKNVENLYVDWDDYEKKTQLGWFCSVRMNNVFVNWGDYSKYGNMNKKYSKPATKEYHEIIFLRIRRTDGRLIMDLVWNAEIWLSPDRCKLASSCLDYQ